MGIQSGFASVLKLSGETPLVTGGRRTVYAHPDEPEWLVKVAAKGKRPEKMSAAKKLIRRAFPALNYKQMIRELESDATTALKLGSQIEDSPLSRSLGVIQTDLGPGVVVERISDGNDGLAITLASLKAQGALTPEVLAQLNSFAGKLFDLQVGASDIHAKNIVYGYRAGVQAFFLIDGCWERNIVPVRSLFRFINDHQLNKRLSRMAERTGLHWDRSQRAFSVSSGSRAK